jgi:ATP-dependent DNA helicase RecQ
MISGVGERKYQLYGEFFINEILEFEQKKNQVAKNSSQSFYETYEFYKNGYSVDEIAQIRRINPVTIYSHLASLYEKGADVDILSFLHANELERTENAVRELGHLNTKELYVHMNEEILYYKIRLATSYLKMLVEA